MTSARDRAARRLGLVLALLVAVAPFAGAVEEEPPPPARGEEPNPLESQRIGAALAGLEERARLVQDMINEAARQYRQVALERAAADQELVTAQDRLDREAVRAREVTASSLSALYRDLLAARARVEVVRLEGDARLQELRRLLGERDALARRVADLRARLPLQEELLTGVWEVTWMPAGVQGTFYLDQSGTLVTGQYRLGAHGSGSLQGTFVNGKLFLQRIDAERGRDAELEGVADPDGSRIRGTWQAYEMVQGGIPQGQWVAKRAR
jgi:hypothetical protein